MFTGIIQGLCRVASVERKEEILKLGVLLEDTLSQGVVLGCSIAIDGTCLTVAAIDGNLVYFDVIPETLAKTTLADVEPGRPVNVERSARIGDEIGGHLVSGHVWGRAFIAGIEAKENHRILHIQVPPEWTKYLFPKGFIAIDGASLTLVDVDRQRGIFTVHVIPETLSRTTLGKKQTGGSVNVEIDSHTVSLVETVERILSASSQK